MEQRTLRESMASNPLADPFDQLYRAHAPSVFRRARALLADDADAQRVVSDVFALVYERPERYLGKPALCKQLWGLTTRACFNRLRSRKLPTRTQPAADGGEADRGAELRALIERLKEPLDQLAVYYYLDELTQEEVTELLGCSRRRITGLLAQLEASARTDGGRPMSLPARTRPPGCVTDLVFDTWFADELDVELEEAVDMHTARCSRCKGRHAALAAERAVFLAQHPNFSALPQQVARKHKRWVLAALLLMAAALIGLAVLAHEDGPLPKTAATAG